MKCLPVEQLLAVFKTHGVSSILDFGCGNGELVRDLLQATDYELDVVGVDETDAGLVGFFNERMKARHFRLADLKSRDGIAGEFDAILCVGALGKMDSTDLPSVLGALRLRAGELCYFSVPLSEVAAAAKLSGKPGVFTKKSGAQWLRDLTEAGFGILDNRLVRDRLGEDQWLHVFADPKGRSDRPTRPNGASERDAASHSQVATSADSPVTGIADAGEALKAAIEAHGRNDLKRAGELYRQTLASQPGNADALHGLGMMAVEKDNFEEGLRLIRSSIEAEPRKPSFHSNLGHCLMLMGQWDDSIAAHRKAIELAPQTGVAHSNYASVLRDAGRLEEAEEEFKKAIELDPSSANARYLLAQLRLLRGDHRALPELRWAFETRFRKWYPLPVPEYRGEKLENGGVAVWGDWGIGDQIMVLRHLDKLVNRSPRVLCICDQRLVPLLSRSFPDVEFVPPMDPLTVRLNHPWITHQLPVCELATIFGIDPEDLEGGKPFLRANPVLVGQLRERYRVNRDQSIIGIAWRGGATQETRSQRSIPLSRWSPLLELENCTFVALQLGDILRDLDQIPPELRQRIIVDPTIDQLRDLDGFAAQISSLDLVVSVDCTAVHIAGALGVPTIVLLPRIPDWRWGLKSTDTPWYESVHLIRQRAPGDWDAPLEHIQIGLRDFDLKTLRDRSYD